MPFGVIAPDTVADAGHVGDDGVPVKTTPGEFTPVPP